MRKFLFAMLTAMAVAAPAGAQAPAVPAQPRRNISTSLRASGRVTLRQDPRLEALIAPPAAKPNAQALRSGNVEMYYASGYRVRVFSGNNQVQSKALAYQIEQELKDRMPDLQTYVVFKTPNWRLLVGNYRTSEEAIAALRDLKKEFPNRGREMFVVKDEIELPID